jgi:HEAT repeat protein
VRSFSNDCTIDAGGLALYWLDKVDPAQSVVFLKDRVAASTNQNRVDGPLSAIAQHADRSAVAVLLDFAKNGTSTQIRRRAMFWVAQRAEAQAVPAITEAIEKDPDTEVKKQAVFALSTMPPDQSMPLLIKLATSNSNPAVRKQAMFWLGQSRDPRALAFFEQLLR